MRVPIAFNYSREAAALLETGDIALDRWKCPPWPDLIEEARRSLPVYIHFDLYAGGGRMASVDWGAVERLLDDTGTPFVNLHLTPTLADFGFTSADLSEAQQARVVETMIADVALVARRFGAERVIVENIPFRGRPERNGWEFVPAAVEPAIFTQVLGETSTGLLLDIAHATISARTLGLHAPEYLAAHPLDRLREIHIGGVRLHEGEPEDHLAMTEVDWALFGGVLSAVALGRAAAPWIVACEYGGLGPHFEWRSAPAVIAADAQRMRELVTSLSAITYPASARSRS
jgi:uncharacterized protein (UPF0276 family)